MKKPNQIFRTAAAAAATAKVVANPIHMSAMDMDSKLDGPSTPSGGVDDVWREKAVEEMMRWEDFIGVKAQEDVRILNPLNCFPQFEEEMIVGFGNGGEISGRSGKRRRAPMEPMDEAALQRQRRMIKNRESAARSRERKHAHQVELELIAARLEEENHRLLKQKLMETVIPVVEKRRPPRALCPGHSFEC
ncbi:G-box-binding factor 4-like isoform X2 [Cucurbita pepo subsp. pepo]|uniref:G-box-binding factor 4-like isoform X2 n=1 Tax=Cucurbita pepo subsp. pepo TaxID=3664 RepID=UPI000C9D3CF9|nr:G-box-binding factor 4-like isoform X2 [Cucurbita pepo subsp. pepo]